MESIGRFSLDGLIQNIRKIGISGNFYNPLRGFATFGPSKGCPVSCHTIGSHSKTLWLWTRGNLLHNEIVHIGGSTVLACTIQNNVTGTAYANRQFVAVPTYFIFNRDSVVTHIILSWNESQFGRTLNLAVSAGINPNTFVWFQ